MNLLPGKLEYDLTFICRKNRQYFAEPILQELQKKYTIQQMLLEHKRELWTRKIKGKVVWIEWATKFALAASRRKMKNRKTVVRLHRFELETPFVNKINWNNIDLVVFVNHRFEREFKQKISAAVQTITIPNAIAWQNFPFSKPEGKRQTRIISYSLTFHPVKGYLQLIRFFKKLLQRAPLFRLTIMARVPQSQDEKRYLAYLQEETQRLEISNKVDFIVREVPVNLTEDRTRVAEILAEHDLFIGFSRLESFHYAFAESMLSGLQCFYNGWQNPYLEEFWSKWACATEKEMIEKIIQWVALPAGKKSEISKENRRYVIDNFSTQVIANKYEKIFLTIGE